MTVRNTLVALLIAAAPAAAQGTKPAKPAKPTTGVKPAKPAKLRWKLGRKTWRYRTVQTKTIRMTEGSRTAVRLIERRTEFSLRAIDRTKAGGVRLELLMSRMREKVTTDGRVNRDRDTAAKTWPDAMSMLKPLRFLISERGQQLGVERFGGLEAKALPAQALQTAKSMVQAIPNAFLGVFPATAVEVGKGWRERVQLKVPGVGEVDIKLLNTLSKIKAGVAHITQASTDSAVKNARFPIDEWTMKGKVQFDLAQGRVIESVLTTRMSVSGARKVVLESRYTMTPRPEVKVPPGMEPR